jgi:hypothetical protein
MYDANLAVSGILDFKFNQINAIIMVNKLLFQHHNMEYDIYLSIRNSRVVASYGLLDSFC